MRGSLSVAALLAAIACGDSSATPIADTEPSGDSGSSSTIDLATGTSSGMLDDASSDGADETSTGAPDDPMPPPCGSLDYAWRGVIAGPAEPAFDATLDDAALRYERVHVALTTLPSGLAGDLRVVDEDSRASIDAFVAGDAWDLQRDRGVDPRDVIESWRKATGAFAGVAAAADAYRYGTLRDQGYACDEIDRARAQLVRAMDGLHLATALTGVPGLVVRAIAHRDWPGDSETATTPIFDANGDPNPLEKTNGTWREDNSGEHPEYVWEDSGSRDQLIGWIAGYGAVWEVVRDDPTIDDALKARLQSDAAAIAQQLMTVRPSGYDLEIWDPEGRPTLHGYLHENNVEGTYYGFHNGQHAIMAAGIIAALAFVAEDPQIDAYLYDELIGRRDLVRVAAQSLFIDFGPATNWSNYNMAFTGAWLVARYLDHDAARADLRDAADRLYALPNSVVPVHASGQALFDLVYAIIGSDASAVREPVAAPDPAAVDRALEVLHAFPAAPGWNDPRENCDTDEIAAGSCTLDDGTVVAVLGTVGHADALVVDQPVPMPVRPTSNFYWRTNPYIPNGDGDGTAIASAADVRFAYWLARFTRATR